MPHRPMLRTALALVTFTGLALMASATTPAPAAAGPEVYDYAKLDTKPSLISQVGPEYPDELGAAGTSGQVLVEFVVGTDGNVTGAHVISSTAKGFEAPAIAAVNQWKFMPGAKNGHKVNTRLRVPIVFALKPQPKN
ncbi:MAG: energy transducer TonB [Opitutales bacterium]